MNLSAALTAACFALFGSLHIAAYPFVAIAGLLAALWLSLHTAPTRGIDPDALWDAGVFAIVAAFVLSRLLGFVLLLTVEHGQLTFSLGDVLRFSSISYLSLLVTAIAVLVWLRWKRLPLRQTIDAWAPCSALLWSALALADAASGAASGLPTRMRWGVRVAGSASGARVHPVALYAAAAALALCGALLALLRRVRTPGRVAAVAIMAAGVIAFLLDMLRVPEQPLTHNLLDMSQWLALASILFGACMFTLVPAAEVR